METVFWLLLVTMMTSRQAFVDRKSVVEAASNVRRLTNSEPETFYDYKADPDEDTEDIQSFPPGRYSIANVDQSRSSGLPNATSPSSHPLSPKTASWKEFGGKEYLFIMDSSRKLDLGRDEAQVTCRELANNVPGSTTIAPGPLRPDRGVPTAGLAAIETEEELEFVSDEIRRRVVEAGQEFAHEQWWTAGRSLTGRWIWEIAGYPTVRLSALRRNDVPKRKKGESHLGPLVSYLALSYGPEKQDWRLRVVPDTFRLRYICQRVWRSSNSKEPISDAEWSLQNHLYSVARGARAGTDVIAGVAINLTVPDWIEMDELSQSTCIRLGLSMCWSDGRISWNERLNYNTSSVLLTTSRIWTPEVLIYDQINGDWRELDSLRGGGRASVTSSGHVTLRSAENVDVIRCTTDRFWFFPFDRWRCTLYLQTAATVYVDIVHSTLARSSCSTDNSKQSSWIVERYHTEYHSSCNFTEESVKNTITTNSSSSSSSSSTSPCILLELDVFRANQTFHLLAIVFPVGLCSLVGIVLLASSSAIRASRSRHHPNSKSPTERVTHSADDQLRRSPSCCSCCCRCCCCCSRLPEQSTRQRGRCLTSSSNGVTSLMATSLVLAFHLQFVCGHVIGLERASSVTHIPLVVTYITLVMTLLVTSACLILMRASSAARRHSASCHHDNTNRDNEAKDKDVINKDFSCCFRLFSTTCCPSETEQSECSRRENAAKDFEVVDDYVIQHRGNNIRRLPPTSSGTHRGLHSKRTSLSDQLSSDDRVSVTTPDGGRPVPPPPPSGQRRDAGNTIPRVGAGYHTSTKNNVFDFDLERSGKRRDEVVADTELGDDDDVDRKSSKNASSNCHRSIHFIDLPECSVKLKECNRTSAKTTRHQRVECSKLPGCIDDVIAAIAILMFACYVIAVVVGLSV